MIFADTGRDIDVSFTLIFIYCEREYIIFKRFDNVPMQFLNYLYTSRDDEPGRERFIYHSIAFVVNSALLIKFGRLVSTFMLSY